MRKGLGFLSITVGSPSGTCTCRGDIVCDNGKDCCQVKSFSNSTWSWIYGEPSWQYLCERRLDHLIFIAIVQTGAYDTGLENEAASQSYALRRDIKLDPRFLIGMREAFENYRLIHPVSRWTKNDPIPRRHLCMDGQWYGYKQPIWENFPNMHQVSAKIVHLAEQGGYNTPHDWQVAMFKLIFDVPGSAGHIHHEYLPALNDEISQFYLIQNDMLVPGPYATRLLDLLAPGWKTIPIDTGPRFFAIQKALEAFKQKEQINLRNARLMVVTKELVSDHYPEDIKTVSLTSLENSSDPYPSTEDAYYHEPLPSDVQAPPITDEVSAPDPTKPPTTDPTKPPAPPPTDTIPETPEKTGWTTGEKILVGAVSLGFLGLLVAKFLPSK